MTTVIEVLARAARQCSVSAPSSWVTTTDAEAVELRDDFMLDTIDDIQERADLPSPFGKQTTITGTGAATYTLPSNFKRMQRDDLAVYDTSLDQMVYPINTDGEWTYLQDIGAFGAVRYYRISGYEGNWTIEFYGAPSATVDLTVSYMSTVWMINGSTEGSIFTADEDVLLLPRRIVETGIIWRFRERKGLPYADKYNEYELLMSRLINDTKGARKISIGDKQRIRWQDNLPAFIPAS